MTDKLTKAIEVFVEMRMQDDGDPTILRMNANEEADDLVVMGRDAGDLVRRAANVDDVADKISDVCDALCEGIMPAEAAIVVYEAAMEGVQPSFFPNAEAIIAEMDKRIREK